MVHVPSAVLIAALSLLAAEKTEAEPASEKGFVPLFDGKSLDGWRNPYKWGEAWAEDGEIRLKANKKFFLLTKKPYGDFIFEAEVMVPEGKANSGFMVRANHAPNKVWGYQAEVDPSERRWAGGLYDEGRRQWLNPLKNNPEAQAAFNRTQWNKYRIEAIGDSLKFYVNGVLTTDYVDAMDIEGPVGIQHHGEKGQVYRFRNLKIKDLGKRKWIPIFNGENLDGWHATPGGEWTVKDGILVGTHEESDKRYGLLYSDATFKDFTVRFKFRALQGDSGFYFRALPAKDDAGIKGYQVEIDPRKAVGGLWESGGRKWVYEPTPELVAQWNKPGNWNELVVSAHGRRIAVTVNGHQTVDLKDDPGRLDGHFGLQLHGGQDVRVEFKDFEILSDATK
ncbi:hypothetical protein Pan216_36510 [Planctomycetes bacterium Pan216]|uniref:3-keto-alpha-glucoside-1,2-lyase/3-keto-2-hydroxy-glucal hydratase domain-containing protein n=1 Tax=Kolteria novifilia TaxID=2527975 RepID=A0A518B747_9BACT|nr:hypothetical protein Pan216_36510 [Planctomycetes bacterium Pan216]